MCATAGDTDFFDGCAAARAGLAVEAKDICELQVTSLFAFGVDVIFVGAAAFFDGELEN